MRKDWLLCRRAVIRSRLKLIGQKSASRTLGRIRIDNGLISIDSRIVGKPEVGLASAKTLLDSSAPSSDEHEIWTFSDMMNETPALPMSALVPTGPDKMLEQVKQNGLVAPLDGYRIHVLGASKSRLSPQARNGINTFWTVYWQAGGAEPKSYSEEGSTKR